MSQLGCNDCEKASGLVIPGVSGVSGGGKEIVIQTDTNPPLQIGTVETATKKVFTISYNQYVGFTASLSIDQITCSPDLKNGVIPLKGVTVTDVNLSWSFLRSGNPIDVAQTLDGSPVTPNSVKSLALTGQTIITDQTFTLVGNDGTTEQTALKTLQFGDSFYRGEYQGFIDASSTDGEATTVIDALTRSIQVSGVGLYVDGTKSGGSWYTYFAVPSSLTPVFDDVNDPSLEDPMTKVKTVLYNNGAEAISYDLYRSVNGALLGSRIQIKSIS